MLETERISFRVGHEPSATLSVFHACRSGPVEGFHEFEVRAVVPGMRAAFTFHTFLRDFEIFRDEIEKMRRSLRGEAQFKSLEGDVELTASIDKLGHVEWQARLMCPSGVGSTLAFKITSDQSFMPNLIAELDEFIVVTKEHGLGI